MSIATFTRSLTPAIVLALAGIVPAQTPVIFKVIPEAAAPGNLIIITGTDLDQATHFFYTATVGGFVGVQNVPVPVSTATFGQATGIMPTVGSFTPPPASPAGSPFGSVSVRDVGGSFSNSLQFYFM